MKEQAKIIVGVNNRYMKDSKEKLGSEIWGVGGGSLKSSHVYWGT